MPAGCPAAGSVGEHGYAAASIEAVAQLRDLVRSAPVLRNSRAECSSRSLQQVLSCTNVQISGPGSMPGWPLGLWISGRDMLSDGRSNGDLGQNRVATGQARLQG